MAEESVTKERLPSPKITVDYGSGRWGKTFHIFDLDNREIVLRQKDAVEVAKNIIKIAGDR